MEKESHYPYAKVEFLKISNIHAVRDSFNEMSEAGSATKYYAAVEKSSWLDHISSVLSGVCRVIESLSMGTSVLVHCSDGWDRTSQLISLAQICLDQRYRTIEGLCTLIEKDWVQFGHRFETRCGHGVLQKHTQQSPIFIQFLDCILQIVRQFPTHFEFSERLLHDLTELVYNGRFGTFFLDTDLERSQAGVKKHTPSVWSYILKDITHYTSPYYRLGQDDIIIPVASVRRLCIWQEYFLQWHADFYLQERARNTRELLEQITSSLMLKRPSIP